MLFTATSIATILFSSPHELPKQDQSQLHWFVMCVETILIYVVASLIIQRNRVECSKKHQQQEEFCQCYRRRLTATSNTGWCTLFCKHSQLAVQIEFGATFQNNHLMGKIVFYLSRTAFLILCAPFATNINFPIRLDLDNVIHLTNTIVYRFRIMTQHEQEISYLISFYRTLVLSSIKVFNDWYIIFILAILFMYLVFSTLSYIILFSYYTSVIYSILLLIDECILIFCCNS